MFSAPADADLLDAANWTRSNALPGNTNWLDGRFGGWLEGNAVVTKEGKVADLLRVDAPGLPEGAALVSISRDGTVASFDPAKGFVEMPGGAKKFTVRFDPVSGFYWSLASILAPGFEKAGPPASIRNTLALICSADLLRGWKGTFDPPATSRHRTARFSIRGLAV